MPRRKAEDDDYEELEEVTEEEDAPTQTKGRAPATPRLSITLPNELRKSLRIAAARADMEVSEWSRVVLVTAARKTCERAFPGEFGGGEE